MSVFTDHFRKGTHAARPAANAAGLPIGAKYACSDHGLVYETDGTAWSTWFDPGVAAAVTAGITGAVNAEFIRDTIGSALVNGSNVTITVNDPGDTITIASTGGGGGGSSFPVGSADAPPAVANAKDDEFDGASLVSWASTPTPPTSWDINTTRLGHAYLKDAAAIGSAYGGKVQAVPASYPYTITAKFTSNGRGANSRRGGIILGPASPTGTSNVWYMGATYVGGIGGAVQERIKATFAGTYVNDNGVYPLPQHWGPYYIKATVASATSVSCWASVDGWSWLPIELAANPGFTPGVMGIAATGESAVDCELFCEFFRVT